MKEELKQKMIAVIGNPDRRWSQIIAEKCAQIAVDHYEGRKPALSMSGVTESVCDNCEPISGFYLGMTCPKCNRPFRSVKQTVR